ncbi:MAG: sugar transferase [Bacteroidales bacterium]|nr:sugar transferase [Candidatus Colimorpha onthohippi]
MYKNGLKRVIDFTIVLIVLIIIWPIFAIISIWLHFANKGAGVFFYQERPGKGEKIFRVIKFKSMTDERDAAGNLLPDKDRITAVGKFIRKTSIDELPQLINVLIGDMALIGPRPLLPEYLPYYTEREKLRHTVRPGISGWAQVNGRSNITWDKKLELDAYYVENLSLWMDIKVILKTFKNLFCATNEVGVVPQGGIGKLNVERSMKMAASEATKNC